MGITEFTVKLFQVRLKRIHPYLNALNGRIRKQKKCKFKMTIYSKSKISLSFHHDNSIPFLIFSKLKYYLIFSKNLYHYLLLVAWIGNDLSHQYCFKYKSSEISSNVNICSINIIFMIVTDNTIKLLFQISYKIPKYFIYNEFI